MKQRMRQRFERVTRNLGGETMNNFRTGKGEKGINKAILVFRKSVTNAGTIRR